MSYLADTNVISELCRRVSNPGVVEWSQGVSQVVLSAVTLEELTYGLSWKPNLRVRSWLEGFLRDHCQVLPVTMEVGRAAGVMRGRLQARGETRSQADMLIAATAALHGLTVVTRNGADFEGCGVSVLNPFR